MSITTPTPKSRIDARYAGATPSTLETSPAPDWNPILDTLLSHRSVRAFAPDPLPVGTTELLVAAAQSAASSSNLQIWSVVAVQDPERKARLAGFAGDQAQIREAPLFLAWLIDVTRLERLAERAGKPAEGLDYLDTFLMGAIDAALAAQNAVTAAESLGLGTVYIGALRNKPELVAEELKLEPGLFAVFGLCVGRPDPARPSAVKPRLPQKSVLFHEQYKRQNIAHEVDDYDRAMNGFYTAQGMPATQWSEHSTERMRSASNLRGRHRLVEALHSLGFKLR
ncbi:MAG: NADPH-dependent oxidoreductase [Polyangiales bacterium]